MFLCFKRVSMRSVMLANHTVTVDMASVQEQPQRAITKHHIYQTSNHHIPLLIYRDWREYEKHSSPCNR